MSEFLYYEPKDRNGHRIQVGDRVRIVGMPDLSGMTPEGIAESRPVFEYLIGRYKRIVEFDEFGFAWFYFRIPGCKFKGLHSVAIEPSLLHLPRSRSDTSFQRTVAGLVP
ncbi:MAG: hypothetical protein FWD77_02320 [Betaproteobacteria bacterium]|nr:hypothetical protein [Betaproteobacteria bacterium]